MNCKHFLKLAIIAALSCASIAHAQTAATPVSAALAADEVSANEGSKETKEKTEGTPEKKTAPAP